MHIQNSEKDSLPPLALELASAKGWDTFTRVLMLAGKALPALPEHQRTHDNSVEGCESPVWLCASDGEIMAYSPSKIIRGVLAVLLERANSLTAEQRSTFDFAAYLEQCQLSRYLSQSRGNGITAVISALKRQ